MSELNINKLTVKNQDEKDILVVEDSNVQAKALKFLLEQNGYIITIAETGIDALNILKEKSFILIISDINMPGMDGYEFCSLLKSNAEFKEIPVILLTSLSDPTDIIMGLQSGADNFITKPYDNEYLLIRIQNLLINKHLRKFTKGGLSLEVIFRGEKYSINSDRQQILDLLISVFETAVERNEKLLKTQESQSQMINRMADKNIELLATYEKLKEVTENLEKQKNFLINEKERSNTIIKSIPDGVIVKDINHNIIMMNKVAEEFLNINFEDVANKPINGANLDDSRKKEFENFMNKLRNEYDFDFKLAVPGCDKKFSKIIHCKKSLIIDSNSMSQGTVTVLSDVTHEREIDRMKTEFLSTTAHELRTPLTSIQGFSEILMTRADLQEKEKIRYLSYINKQAVKLACIINDLLDIARIESGDGFALNKQVYDVKQGLEELIPYFTSISKNHYVELDISHTPILCMADKDKIEQVIKNLISNSIKYSPVGGIIKIKGDILGDLAVISVKDQGIGMTSDQLKNIFNKFYRVDSSDSAPEGTGLGMTIVKYLIEAHGGTVWLESESGKGTTVFFTIPLHNIEKKVL